jgi:hypothetical protein
MYTGSRDSMKSKAADKTLVKTVGVTGQGRNTGKSMLFTDNRSETMVQGMLRQMVASSARVSQLKESREKSGVIQAKYGTTKRIAYPKSIWTEREANFNGEGANPLANFAIDYDTDVTYWSNPTGVDKHSEDQIYNDRGDPVDEQISIYSERFPCSVCDRNIKSTNTVWNVEYTYDGDEATADIARWLVRDFGRYRYKGKWYTKW